MCDDVGMSKYGRSWEEVAVIRRRLREELSAGVDVGTLEAARAAARAAEKEEELRHLLSDWAHYEREMARAGG